MAEQGSCIQVRRVLSEIVELLQDRSDLTPELEYSWWLLSIAILTDLTAKLNELNIGLQHEKKPSIQMTDTTELRKLMLWKTQLM